MLSAAEQMNLLPQRGRLIQSPPRDLKTSIDSCGVLASAWHVSHSLSGPVLSPLAALGFVIISLFLEEDWEGSILFCCYCIVPQCAILLDPSPRTGFLYNTGVSSMSHQYLLTIQFSLCQSPASPLAHHFPAAQEGRYSLAI